jgi:hypothetical protein
MPHEEFTTARFRQSANCAGVHRANMVEQVIGEGEMQEVSVGSGLEAGVGVEGEG